MARRWLAAGDGRQEARCPGREVTGRRRKGIPRVDPEDGHGGGGWRGAAAGLE